HASLFQRLESGLVPLSVGVVQRKGAGGE
ncbi:MAG: hypothetical protein H6Q04_3060, partial [Acidobacteria bacterium]|nr:hypothetical protein [Acidobacteriota bacterium]